MALNDRNVIGGNLCGVACNTGFQRFQPVHNAERKRTMSGIMNTAVHGLEARVTKKRRMTRRYDCVVIGGGPAGATVAALLADAGKSVLVLERGNFPRFHIGESLMPETYWTFQRLGMLPKLKDSDFVKK